MNIKEESFIEKWKQRAKVLKKETYSLFLAYKDPRTPWYAKVFTGLVVAYAFSPIDLIPDFIPVLGYLDDLILVPLGITLAIKMIPSEVLADARKQAVNPTMNKGTGIFITVVILIIWASIIFYIIAALIRLFNRTQ